MNEDKIVAMSVPEWLKGVKNDSIAGAIFALMYDWQWDGEEKEVENLREYVSESFDDLSEDEIAEVCDLLVEHGVVK